MVRLQHWQFGKKGRQGWGPVYQQRQQQRQLSRVLLAASQQLSSSPPPAVPHTDGRTALMLACVKGYRETVQLLLEAGADCNARDAFGGTAM